MKASTGHACHSRRQRDESANHREQAPNEHRQISPAGEKLLSPVEFALMAADDPLPGLLDLPLFAYKHFHNAYETMRKGVPSAKGCAIKS